MKTNQKPERRNLSNTLSAGVKSLRGGGRKFYVLEFKTPSQLKKSNTTQEIIIDYIELGRDPKCQVVFGEDCRTVSGVHCSISREGEDYFIRHLSKTNPTLVNGKPVADRWYLNSGDEIRLAYDGPLIGFIVPQNNLTSSIPLTRRMELFRDQALRPFKA
ncbi:MAG: FHA domain-containing protein, partial [Planctomycetes bacterium]|nr:FHA domain-containing protein [Planctomycetota bacterium]